jgi:hypothetical protein
MDNASEQHIVVFEEDGSADCKIAGMEVYGKNILIKTVYNIQGPFDEFIDEPERYISSQFTADLVLDFLRHPDLSAHLVSICNRKNIPVIASGQHIPGAESPFTCCGLGKKKGLGHYAAQFGVPEYEVTLQKGRISSVSVRRGASCGATWQVAGRLVGMTPDDAANSIGREVQYICSADPSAFDPVTGHNALHFAGEIHMAALKKALKKAEKSN